MDGRLKEKGKGKRTRKEKRRQEKIGHGIDDRVTIGLDQKKKVEKKFWLT